MSDCTRTMHEAIAVAHRGIRAGESPFGAAISDAGGNLIAAAHNTVRSSCDSTAHAEINAIREACRRLGTIKLDGCVMAATCEPCPMCAAAIHWAGITDIAFGADIEDARSAGFNELPISCRTVCESGGPVTIHSGVLRDECRGLFEQWQQGPNPNPY